MKIGIVGRGSLGTALGISAESAQHEVCLFRRKSAQANPNSPIKERVLDAETDWSSFDLVLLAFEKKADSPDDLRNDETLACLLNIPPQTPIASVVLSPSTQLLDAFLEGHTILHFVSTPAAALPGAVALIRETVGSETDREPLMAASSEQHFSQERPDRVVSLPAFLKVSAIQKALSRGRFHVKPTGPPPSDRTTLLQVMLC